MRLVQRIRDQRGSKSFPLGTHPLLSLPVSVERRGISTEMMSDTQVLLWRTSACVLIPHKAALGWFMKVWEKGLCMAEASRRESGAFLADIT